MKKLIYFQIIVFIVCLSQVSFGAGYRHSGFFALNISRTSGCTQISQLTLSSIVIKITSKTSATMTLNIAGGSYNAASTLNGTISGTTIDFGTKTINSSTCSANAAINIALTCTITPIGGSTISCSLKGVASGAFVGNNTFGSVTLSYFNGNNGEATEKANAVVYSPTGIAKSSGAICTSDIVDVQLFGDNYQGVQLYLDGTPLGTNVPNDNAFSVRQGFIRFTMADKGIFNEGIHTISLDVNGTRTTYATFQTYTPIATNVVAASKSISCYGEAINLSVATLPNGVTYNWQDSFGVNVSPRSISNFSQEYYIIMSKPGRTCETNSNKVKIDVIPDFTASISPNKTQACEGQTIQLNASPNDGNQYNFEWSNGSKDNNIFVPDNNGGNGYSVKITPKIGGCDSKTSNTVNNLVFEKGITGDKISVTNKTSPIFCKDEANITLTATADGGVANLGIQWSGPKSGTGDKLQVESGGVYTLQLSKGDCKTTPKTITVIGKITPTFTLNPSDAQICRGQKMSLSTTNDANYTYQWFGGTDGKTADLTKTSATNDATDGGLYRVVLTPNGGNCNATTGVYEVSQQVKVDVPITNFQITGRKANDIVPICNLTNGVNLVATSDNDVSISWNGGAKILSSNTIQNIKDEKTYVAEFKRGKCEASIAVTTKIQALNAKLKETIDATRRYITCSDNTDFKLVAESNFATATFKWKDANDPNFSNTNKEFAPTKAGKYYAIANSTECGATDSDPTKQVEVILPPDFKVNIASQFASPICEGLEQTLTATPTYTAFAGTYTWVPANTSNVIKTKTAGNYALTIQQDGCKASATASFTTKASKPTITVVDNFNLFASPNTDNYEWLFKTLPSSSDPKSYNSLSPKETKDKLFSQTVGSYILKGNRNGCAEAHSDPIEITIVTLASENTNSNTWKVYPNPSNNVVTIENNSLDFLQSNVIELRNSAGILVRYFFQSEKSKEYNVDDLSSGTYHLIFKQKNSTIVKKIIKL